MKCKYISSRLIVGVVIILLSTISNAFSEEATLIKKQIYKSDVRENNISIKVPHKTKYVIAVDENGKTLDFKRINNVGVIVNTPSCVVCTAALSKKYGDSCKKLRDNKQLRIKVMTKNIGKKYADLSFCSIRNKSMSNVVKNTTANTVENIKSNGAHNNIIMFIEKRPICIYEILNNTGEVMYRIPEDCMSS